MFAQIELNADVAGDVLTIRSAHTKGCSACTSSDVLPPDRERVERVAAFRSSAGSHEPTHEHRPIQWNASTTELIDWFRANRDRLPSEPFCLWLGA